MKQFYVVATDRMLIRKLHWCGGVYPSTAVKLKPKELLAEFPHDEKKTIKVFKTQQDAMAYAQAHEQRDMESVQRAYDIIRQAPVFLVEFGDDFKLKKSLKQKFMCNGETTYFYEVPANLVVNIISATDGNKQKDGKYTSYDLKNTEQKSLCCGP